MLFSRLRQALHNMRASDSELRTFETLNREHPAGAKREPLLTAIVTPKGTSWDVGWVAEPTAPETPKDFRAATLTDTIQKATKTFETLRISYPADFASFQCAIYPWEQIGKNLDVLDVTEEDEMLNAASQEAGHSPISAPTFDELLLAVRSQSPGRDAMLVWHPPGN